MTTLVEFFRQHPKVALCFSGGVDSSFLLYFAVESGVKIRPYFIKTQFQPAFELDDGIRLTKECGIDLQVIEADVLENPDVIRNDELRCYYCKRRLFGILTKTALRDGFSTVIDGSNASDDCEDRPGMRAKEELGVLSPLRECGLTKSEIRDRSRAAGLFTWNKPAYACLATRIPVGESITEQKLKKIEMSEQYLSSLGFVDFRVRLFNGCARIQLPDDQMQRLLERKDDILSAFSDFDGVFLDLEGRT